MNGLVEVGYIPVLKYPKETMKKPHFQPFRWF